MSHDWGSSLVCSIIEGHVVVAAIGLVLEVKVDEIELDEMVLVNFNQPTAIII